MTWVVWRQYRLQAAIALALLAAFTAFMLVTGLQVASQWHAALRTCTADHACGNLPGTLFLGSHAVGFLVIMTLGVPAVLGILLGAPLLAAELESRTNEWAWAQSITRARWLAAKIGWPLLLAAVLGGAVSALVTWWSGPDNALQANAFDPGRFDIMGIAPVGYTVFAMALGICAGAVLRRVVPAIAVTLVGFIAVRFVIFSWLRARFISPVTTVYALTRHFAPGGAWQLDSGYAGPAGQPIAAPQSVTGQVLSAGGNGLPVSMLPHPCQALAGSSGPLSPAAQQAVLSCAQAHGVRAYLTYQPANRYWAFQGIETGIFLLLGAALIAATVIVLNRRDA